MTDPSYAGQIIAFKNLSLAINGTSQILNRKKSLKHCEKVKFF